MTISTAVCIASMDVVVATFMTNFFVYKNWDFKANTKILRVIITWLQHKRSKFGNLGFQQLTKCFSTTSWSYNYTHFTSLQLFFWDACSEEIRWAYLLANIIYSKLYQVKGPLRTKKN